MKRWINILFLLIPIAVFGQMNTSSGYRTAAAYVVGGSSGNSYTQDFDDLSTGDIDGKGNWVVIDGAINITDHGGSNAFDGAGDWYNAALYDATVDDDQISQITAYVQDYGSPGPACRMTAGSGGSYYGLFHETSSALHLVRVVNGSGTILATSTTGWTDGVVVKLEAEGDTLFCYKGGILDTSLSGDGKYTDDSASKLSTGKVGVMVYFQNSSAYGHTWSGGDK